MGAEGALSWKIYTTPWSTWPYIAYRGRCVARRPIACSDAGLAINRSRVRIPAAALTSATLGKLFKHVCLRLFKDSFGVNRVISCFIFICHVMKTKSTVQTQIFDAHTPAFLSPLGDFFPHP